MPSLLITKKAHKQIAKLTPGDRRSIYQALEALERWPDCRNVKRLATREDFRLRIGDFRAFFTVDAGSIIITEVKKRDERTY